MEIFGRAEARLERRQRSVQGRRGHVPQSLHGRASPGLAVAGYELFPRRPLLTSSQRPPVASIHRGLGAFARDVDAGQ